MVFKQCMVCNRKVPGSKKSCVCGHVFTERKMIGRKRYSGYRAMLCSRNDPRKKNLKKNTSPRLMLKESKRPSTNPKTTRKLSKGTQILGEENVMKSGSSTQVKLSHRCIDINSPEFMEKLNDALSSINKKLAKQSVLWMVLKSSNC